LFIFCILSQDLPLVSVENRDREAYILFPLKMVSFGTIEIFDFQWYDALVEKPQPRGRKGPGEKNAPY